MYVISARKGEFESGYEGGGQTREHVILAKTLGVSKLIVVVNKMDDPTVEWSKERMPISEKSKDMGNAVMGKVESGSIQEVKHVPMVTEFLAELQFLELGNNDFYAPGYPCTLHIHTAVENCMITELIRKIDLKTRKHLKKKIVYAKNGDAVV
ncbi:unnamed protein product [Cochlearia groenlandica]